MLDRRHRQLLDEGINLFSKSQNLMTLFQELAENFYPERANFTVRRTTGDEFASNLDTSYPIVARRDLGNAFGAMLRPSEKQWFHNRAKRTGIEDEPARQWLAMTDRVQTRAIYDRASNFVRATKEADHDFATFGQAVLSSEPSISPTAGPILLHRDWHLRDCRWTEDSYGQVNAIHRRWAPGARELMNRFPGKVHDSLTGETGLAKKDPFKTVNCVHVVVDAKDYEKKFRTPFVSIYMDTDNEHLLEEKGSWNRIYIVPRWETVSGSQYAYSPAAIAALPDARLVQAMTYTLLTAGEFAVEPPMIGVEEAIKGAIEIFPGGFTPVDAQYDERLGEVLRPLHKGGEKAIPLGLEMNQDIRNQIAEAFYLTKLQLPPAGGGGMSPLEIQERMAEFIRQALPLFEPMEQDYNGALMELDFDILLRNGAFGPAENIPESLRGQETEFRFESPLRDATDRINSQKFLEAKGLAAEASTVDPLAVQMIDWKIAHRDAQHGNGTPPAWMRTEEQMAEIEQAEAQKQKVAELLQTVSAGAQVAEQVGTAGQSLGGGEPPPEQEGV